MLKKKQQQQNRIKKINNKKNKHQILKDTNESIIYQSRKSVVI